MKCLNCGETKRTWLLWRGFAHAPGADVVCCLVRGLSMSGWHVP